MTAANPPTRKVSNLEWTIATESDRGLCSSGFLGLCFLLSMAAPDEVLYSPKPPVVQLLPNQECIIFAREPTTHFRVEGLTPLDLNPVPLQVVMSAHEYVMGLFVHFRLREAASLYSLNFFTVANLQLFLAVGPWNMLATACASEESFAVLRHGCCFLTHHKTMPCGTATPPCVRISGSISSVLFLRYSQDGGSMHVGSNIADLTQRAQEAI